MHKRLILIIWLIIVFAPVAKADHIVGSEINYIYTGGNNYTVFTKIFRNCNDCKLNGNGGGTNTDNCNDISKLYIYGYNNTLKKYDLLGDVATTRVSITDLTNLCPGETSTCQNTSTFGFGVEQHLFESTVDLSTHLSNDYKEYKFAITTDARSQGISSLSFQNHFNFCYLNAGLVKQSSPSSEGLPFNRVNTNDAIYKSVKFDHTNFDSVCYKLDTAYISETVKNSYPIGHSPSKPVGVIAGNDGFSYKPKGVTLDIASGQLTFTPIIAGDIGVFVIQCEGYKRVAGLLKLVSIVRKDFECIVSNGNNNSPYFYGLPTTIWQACEGEIFAEDIYYRDDIASGVNDTVYLTQDASSNPYALNLQHTVQNYPPFRTSNFVWNVPNGSAQKDPYTFTMVANDSNCPNPGISYYNYRIKVSKANPVTFTKTQTNCNQFTFYASGHSDSAFLLFTILDENGIALSGSEVYNDTAKLEFPTKGKWYIKLLSQEKSAPCSYTYLDSVDIIDFIIPSIDLGPDVFVCPNTSTLFNPAITIDNAPAQFKWTINGFDINNNKAFLDSLFTSNQTIIAQIEDTNNCFVEDTLEVVVKPKWNNTLKDTGACIGFSNPLYLPSAIEDTLALISRSFSGTNVSGDYFSASGLPLGSYKIFLNVEDTVNCQYVDSFNVTIGLPFIIEHKPLGGYCQKTPNIDLELTAQPIPAGGTWTYSTMPSLITGGNFDLQTAGEGNYDINYSVTQNGCTVDTLMPLEVFLSPSITFNTPLPDSICQNQLPFEIDVQEFGVVYDINGDNDSVFNASLYDDSALIQLTRTHAINSCISKFEKNILIDSFIRTQFTLNANPICFEQNQIKLQISDNKYPSNWSSLGSGAFTQVSPASYNYDISAAEKNNLADITFNILLESRNSCPNLEIDTTVSQNKELSLKYLSFNLQDCEPGQLELTVDDRNFVYYDSVSWKSNAVNEIGNGFANNNHTFRSLPSGLNNLKISPFINGCTKTFDTVAEVFIKPDPQITASPQLYFSARFPNVEFRIDDFVPSYTYRWESTPQYNVVTGGNPYKFEMPGDTGLHTFSLFTTSDKGCKDTLNYSLIALPKDWLLVPNAFTPNNDGPTENELFKPQGRVTSDYQFEVFNFWGAKVFSTTDFSQGWDGKYKGKMAETGNYLYVIKFMDDIGRPNVFSGNVILLY